MMDRKKGILAAGTFTGLILITILALGFGSLRAQAIDNSSTAPAAVEQALPEANGMSNEEALQAWQAYSAQLEQTVQTMQDRDAAYQHQLESANQTILQLQDQVNSANSAPVFNEREAHEHEEHEHEHEEHEEYDD